MLYITYADLESLIKRIDGCANSPDKSSTTKIGERILCGYSMSTIQTLDGTVNKHNIYRGENYMKKFCESLREYAMEMINFEKKKMVPQHNEQQQMHEKPKICCICKRALIQKYAKDKKYCNVRDFCQYTGKYRGAAHSICNLKYTASNKNLVVFHSVPNYDYHFILKKLANELLGLSKTI